MSEKTIQQLLVLLFSLLLFFIPMQENQTISADGSGEIIYVIPIEREVERGLEAFLKRATEEAVEAHADHIIFEIDTPGGRVDSAGQIATILQNLEIPTTSFIMNQALSAGSYIALNTNNIYFKPHATMGSSGVITGDGNAADKKSQSAWLASMRTAAESGGRDPLYAAAMADPSIDLAEYGAPVGEYLTLGPNEAVEVGYAEGIVNHREGLLHELGLQDATIVEMEPSPAEEIARFITHPVVIPILLSIASIGLIVELYSPGFGLPGIMAITSLVLFFYGHIVAGLAGMEAIILLIVGVGLIIAEFFVTSGFLGLIGAGAVIGSLFLAGYDLGQMALSISIAFVVSIILAVILYRVIGFEKGIFKKIILRDQTSTESGYVSTENRLELIGMEGITMTPLRPSGVGEFGEEQLDIITEGGFVERDTPIKIVKVEGVRLVVRKIK